MALTPGTRFGPYEVTAPIGAGGMGEVYRARDTRLDRIVAIKVLPCHLSSDPDLKQRFEREARAISSLNHPHICTLYDIGTQEGIGFLVMEYLEGETLAHRLQKGALGIEQALKIGTEMADALDKAHRRGIIHRDVKPSNIMLTKSGAKLTDFGLAKPAQRVTAAASSGATPTVSKALTVEGTLIGTLQYMAPEQLQGAEADVRSDIFAFGAVLYEMLTGRQAFPGKNPASIIAAILTSEPPPVAQLQPMSPPSVGHAVKHALAKDPDERWQTAQDLACELRWIQESGSQLTTAVGSVRRWNWRELMAWSVTAVALAAVLLIARTRPAVPSDPVQFHISAPVGINYPFAIVSPDGRRFAISDDEENYPGAHRQIWLRNLNSVVAQLLLNSADAHAVFWSPDSRYIAFTAGGKLRKMLLPGGSPETICDALGEFSAGTWGSQGTILFSIGENPGKEGIYIVAAQGGIPTRLPLHDESGVELLGFWPEFLPDGRHFLYVGRHASHGQQMRDSEGNLEQRRIYLGDVASGKSRRLEATDSRAEYAAPGYLLFVREGNLLAQPFDGKKLQIVGDPAPIAERVRYHQPTAFAIFSSSQNGTLAYRTGGALLRLAWYDRSGKELGQAVEPGEYDPPSFRLSPDARHLATAESDPATGALTDDIWITDLARKSRLRFTTDPGDEFNPIWSPDGRRIVFSADWKAVPNLYQQKLEGGQAETLLAPTGIVQVATDWSRDGRWILLQQREPGGKWEVWALPLFGERKPVRITQPSGFSETQARFSPDGRWLCYESDESGRLEIYVQAFERSGEKNLVSIGGGSQPRWRADGKELFYLAEDGKVMAVSVQAGPELKIGDPRALFLPKSSTVRYDVSPDGQRFLIATFVAAAQTTVLLNWTGGLPSAANVVPK
jgi:eukaryotic-like serine/threonine-protein kinase